MTEFVLLPLHAAASSCSWATHGARNVFEVEVVFSRLLSKRIEFDSSRKMAQMISPPFLTQVLLLSAPGGSEVVFPKGSQGKFVIYI